MATSTSATGFPDATTTGVPAGVTLKNSGPLVINTPGAVIEGLNITGSVIINAPNVTLLNCKITSSDYDVVLIKPGITGAVIQNCDIDNKGAGGQGIAGQGTFLNNNIHDCVDGIDVRGDNTVIQGNYIHNMRGPAGSHLDGIQADGGFSNLSIIGNTVINEGNQTSAVMLDNYWGPINNVKIDGNLLVGGGYTVYINEVAKGQAGGGPVTNVTFTNNHLGAGSWGTLDIRSELGHQPTVSGNINDGATIAKGLQTTGQPSGGGTVTPPPVDTTKAPTIDKFSPDSGIKGDGITNNATLTLNGTASASSVVKIYDGAKQIGSTTADANGAWTYTTTALNDGNHSLVAKVADASGKTLSSSATSITIDTVAPTAPTLKATVGTGADAAHVSLTGIAEANSTVTIFDSGKQIATVTADKAGVWTYGADNLATGIHSITVTATDAAGNTGVASTKAAVTINPVATTPPADSGSAPSASGFPDATTTGVPASVTLKDSGPLVINTPGAVIEGLNITGSVIINAPNVTLLNCKITSGDYDVVLIKPGITGAVIQNCDIDNKGAGGQGIAGQGTFLNNNIHDCVDGIDVRGDNTVIQGNFIHNMRGPAGSHLDGIQADGGFSNLSIIGNTVINESGQTSAVMLDNYWGPINNVKIDGNLLVGGGYTVYINEVAKGQAGGGPVTNVTFTNNHLGAGYWGTLDIRSELGHQPTVSGNVNDGKTIVQSLQMTGQPSGTHVDVTPPAPTMTAPTIDKFSPDSGIKGDGITNSSSITLNGTAAANSTVSILDGTKKIGSATADNNGQWSYVTSKLADGDHNLTASITDSSGHSVVSSVVKIAIDTVAPAAPTLSSSAVSGGAAHVDHLTFTGSAEANSTVSIFDGAKQIGTASADGKGAWSFDANGLANGNHTFTAKDMDAAGNTSTASSVLAVKIDTAIATHSATFTDIAKNGNGTVTFKGTADANSQIKIYDDSSSKALGTVKTNADGTWSFTTKSSVTNATHDYTAKVVDSSGSVIDSSGHASLGTSGADTIKSTSGNDLMVGGRGQDTFVFGANFGHDVIKDFQASGKDHDIVQFSKSVFDNFADVLSHATASGGDVVITAATGDTLTLKNTKMSALDKGDFHFA